MMLLLKLTTTTTMINVVIICIITMMTNVVIICIISMSQFHHAVTSALYLLLASWLASILVGSWVEEVVQILLLRSNGHVEVVLPTQHSEFSRLILKVSDI